tara:strand:+ start:1223 stop:2512 length:1290 start_codon:yes stop_codon:yes gene_type:complete
VTLNKLEKSQLTFCLSKAKNFIIITTGRAGTDFLQSCYDQHPEIASTCEKSVSLIQFIRENKVLLPESSEVFSALAIKELLFSFSPYINLIEDWRISKKDLYINSDVRRFIDALSYLLKDKRNLKDEISIIRLIILSFSFSIKKDITKISSILIHLHSIELLKEIDAQISANDLVLICSRNPYDLLASGVFHWRKYWSKQNLYERINDISLYRKVLKRTLCDYEDLKKFLIISKPKIYLTILEKLSKKDYLNLINKNLQIKKFSTYPNSTVLGMKRRGDLLSNDKRKKALGKYDSKLVNRGSPFQRIGILDTIIITLISNERIKKYNLKRPSKILKKIINLSIIFRFLLLIILIPFPTKIEIIYFRDFLKNILKILFLKINFKQKSKKLVFGLFYVFLYPIEYIRIRYLKLSIFISSFNSSRFIDELKY